MQFINVILAMQRVESTMGLTLYRFYRYTRLAFAFMLVTALTAGTGFAVGAFLKSPGVFGLLGAVAGFLVCIYFTQWSRRGRLYLLWGPHLALFSQLLEQKVLPKGMQQMALGTRLIQRLFTESQQLFHLQSAIGNVLTGLANQKMNLSAIANTPLIGGALNYLMGALFAPLRDAIMIRASAESVNNPWGSVQKDLDVIHQHYPQLQRSSLMVALFQVVATLFACLVWYVAVDWLTDHWPTIALDPWKYLSTGCLTWIMVGSFIYPIAVLTMSDELGKILSAELQEGADRNTIVEDVSAYAEIIKQTEAYQLPELELGTDSAEAMEEAGGADASDVDQ